MCGIIGYVGSRDASPFIIRGLKILEYRGYDSAGVALVNGRGLEVRKVQGKITDLETLLEMQPLHGMIGIGHTRWATHGKACKENAHPHISQNGKVAVVHNGTIENFLLLRNILESEGYTFASETDTEVIPNLIERELKHGMVGFGDAVAKALSKVQGAYAIATISENHPGEIVAARKSSPLVIGFGEKELLVASDSEAFAGKAHSVMYLRDGEIVSLKKNGSVNASGQEIAESGLRIEKAENSSEGSDKGAFAHLMLKEIMDQPRSLERTLKNRLDAEKGTVRLGGLNPEIEKRLCNSRSIHIVACGSSLYAAMVGKLLIEKLARMPVEISHASEFQYRDPILNFQDSLIGISQSGETADTLRSMNIGKERGALCLGITNKVGSAIASSSSKIFCFFWGSSKMLLKISSLVFEIIYFF